MSDGPEPPAPRRGLLTPGEVRDLLARHGLAPRKAFGQNFVVDANTVRKVVRDAGVQEGDVVAEIGPGLGSLTLALREAGAEVVAVEVDAGMVRALRDVVGDDPGVRVVHADALAVDWAALVSPGSRLVANLPYNVATPLLFHALSAEVFATLLVMVQKEVGQRWAAGRGHPLHSGVSVRVGALADVRIAGSVPRTAFRPVPNVDSVTVALAPRPWPYDTDRQAVFALVEAGFGQRRKRLRNALAAPDRPPVAVEAALERADLGTGARAEELELADWVRLTAALTPAGGA